jgi:hypothetical protein
VYAGLVDVTDGTAQNTWPATRNVLQAKKYINHPDYMASKADNDISLVYLPVDLYYSTNTAILNLYLKDPATDTSRTDNFYGKTVKLAGWGQTNSSNLLSNTLKTTTMTLQASCFFDFADNGKSMCAMTLSDTAYEVTILF